MLTTSSATKAGGPALDAAPDKKKREYKDMEEKHAGDQHAKVDMNTVSRSLVSQTISLTRTDSIHRYRSLRQRQGRH
jgi:hypothetical protein